MVHPSYLCSLWWVTASEILSASPTYQQPSSSSRTYTPGPLGPKGMGAFTPVQQHIHAQTAPIANSHAPKAEGTIRKPSTIFQSSESPSSSSLNSSHLLLVDGGSESSPAEEDLKRSSLKFAPKKRGGVSYRLPATVPFTAQIKYSPTNHVWLANRCWRRRAERESRSRVITSNPQGT